VLACVGAPYDRPVLTLADDILSLLELRLAASLVDLAAILLEALLDANGLLVGRQLEERARCSTALRRREACGPHHTCMKRWPWDGMAVGNANKRKAIRRTPETVHAHAMSSGINRSRACRGCTPTGG